MKLFFCYCCAANFVVCFFVSVRRGFVTHALRPQRMCCKVKETDQRSGRGISLRRLEIKLTDAVLGGFRRRPHLGRRDRRCATSIPRDSFTCPEKKTRPGVARESARVTTILTLSRETRKHKHRMCLGPREHHLVARYVADTTTNCRRATLPVGRSRVND